MPHPPPPTLSLPDDSCTYVLLAAGVTVAAGYWNVFTKADRNGWECLIPGWNVCELMTIVGRPRWWAAGFLLAPMGIWFVCAQYHANDLLGWLPALPGGLLAVALHCRISCDLAKSFGRGIGYAWGLILLPMIYVPMLGFGYCDYIGPGAGRSFFFRPKRNYESADAVRRQA